MLVFKITIGNCDFKFKVKIIVTNYGFFTPRKKKVTIKIICDYKN